MSTPKLARTNLAEQAYAVIRRLLLEGSIAQPGAKISAEDLSRRLGVSRSPVWAALTRLEAEGIIQVRPRQGVYFLGFNRDKLMEIFAAREVLEGAAARLAAGRATGQAVAELRDSVRIQRQAIAPMDQTVYGEEATRFHQMLADLSGNSVMAEMIGRLWDQTQAMCIRPDAQVAILDARVEEHARIVEAVARGDGDEAEAETKAHIRRIAEEVYRLGNPHP